MYQNEPKETDVDGSNANNYVTCLWLINKTAEPDSD